MKAEVAFQGEILDLDVPEGRLVAVWRGPRGEGAPGAAALLARALEEPRDFPPLRKAAVPGDHVVVAFGADVPEPSAVLHALADALAAAGVERADLTVLADAPAEVRAGLARATPEGASFRAHDPDDRAQLAYLANTAEGRRVYLNRLLTDADLVVSVGRLGFDPVFGHNGPWSVLFPGLSDAETRQAYRALAAGPRGDRGSRPPALKESAEVSWLLGSQFQVGILSGVTGLHSVVAGLNTAVIDEGSRAVDRVWGFEAESRAELVVAGVGLPGDRPGIEALARALTNATRLVQRGGKVVLLSRAEGEPGPALTRLRDLDDPRAGLAALKAQGSAPDYPAAREVAQALAWADVYLFSALDPDVVESLGIIPLDRPDDARRLARSSGSTLVVSQADQTRARVTGEAL